MGAVSLPVVDGSRRQPIEAALQHAECERRMYRVICFARVAGLPKMYRIPVFIVHRC